MNALYDDYTQIDTKWMNSVPSHWTVLRLKRILQNRKERNSPVVTDFILSLTAKQGVVPHTDKEGAGGNKPKDDLTKYNVARENDLLVNCMNVVAGSAGVSKWDGAISPVYYALYPRQNNCNIWFYHYIFRLLPFQRSLIGLGKGILMHESSTGSLNTVRMRISMDYLNNVLLPIPPSAEQDQIVRYLDWQISKTNKLISALKKQIALLNEQKQAVINEAVTKGLNPDAPMKDSGVAWIGEINKNVKLIKLRHLLNSPLQYGTNAVGIPYDNNLYRYIRITDITLDGKLKFTDMLSMAFDDGEKYKLNEGDILFARSGATVGKTFIYRNEYGLSCFAGYLIRATVNTNIVIPDFVSYCTKSAYYALWLNQIFIQSTIQNVSAEKYKNLLIPVWSLEEQNKIVLYLNERCSSIDVLVENIKKEIEMIAEYRTRLIADVVTGQIDVRGVEIPDYEFVTDESDETSDDESSDIEEAEDE